MIFLRAFPFSFSILWRFAIALPALIISLIAFAFLAVILFFVAGLISPFIAILIMVAFGVGASVVPVMVGLRVGLQAHHIKPRNTYLGMMKPAIGYGFFEAVAMLVLLAICAGLFLVLTGLSPRELLAMDLTDEEALMAQLLDISPLLTWAMIGVVAFAAFALRSALLVPFAGASVGADPSGRPHTPFYGFGSGFAAVFALVLLSQVGLTAAVPLAIYIVSVLGIAPAALLDLQMMATFDEFSDFGTIGTDAYVLIGIVLLLFLFFFSLQCAGAVLVYVRKRNEVGSRQQAFDEAMRKEEERARPMQDTDLRELVRSRMPDKKY